MRSYLIIKSHKILPKFYNAQPLYTNYFYLPKSTIMQKTTSIEVKCECSIPFHSELESWLYKLLSGSVSDEQLQEEVPHREAIYQALHRRMLFIKIKLVHPVKQWRHKLLIAVRRILGKELVGTIQAGKNAITLIVL